MKLAKVIRCYPSSPVIGANWDIVTATVQGADHIKSGKPNQDAVTGWRSSDGRLGTVFVADGHGDANCPRSAFGSREAVRCAVEVAKRYLTSLAPKALHGPRALAGQLLLQEIHELWRQTVLRNVADHPFSDDDYREATRDAKNVWIKHPERAFGTTLLGVLAYPGGFMVLQIGDGSIVAVTDKGEEHATRLIISPREYDDERTESLCDPQAVAAALIHVESLPSALPICIILSTDGWEKSYDSKPEFMAVGPEIWQSLKRHGAEAVAGELPACLEQTSAQGFKGDDITCGILFRQHSLPS